MSVRLLHISGALLLSVAAAGCGPTLKEYEPHKEARAYRVAISQLPADPVYSRLRWARPPSMLPVNPAEESPGQAPRITPVMHLEVKEMRLEDVARLLASSSRYGHYCASSIAEEKITLNRLGTIDELAREIELSARVRVVIDHEARQVSFTAGRTGVPPQLF